MGALSLYPQNPCEKKKKKARHGRHVPVTSVLGAGRDRWVLEARRPASLAKLSRELLNENSWYQPLTLHACASKFCVCAYPTLTTYKHIQDY